MKEKKRVDKNQLGELERASNELKKSIKNGEELLKSIYSKKDSSK